MRRKLYLAGPMSGIPQFNFPAFREAAKALRELGHDVISPAELDEQTQVAAEAEASPDGDTSKLSETWGDLLSRDVKIVADEVQGVAFLPNWHKSRGAKLEAYVGVLCGHAFYLYRDQEVTPVSTKYVLDNIREHTA